MTEKDAARTALGHVRICDLSGQLAGAGATRFAAALGAEVIRVEDPVRMGRWDVLRGAPPFVDERRGNEFGGAFNNHNVEKLGVTINLRTPEGKEVFDRLVSVSDVVMENFAAGVMARMGYSYERLRELRPDIIYVSNCGFGHSGPYAPFKTWGPVVQAFSGLTFSSGLPDRPSAGFGFSYMDHQGANFMVIATLGALAQRHRTGEGQWIDMSCAEAGATLLGPSVLDFTVNGRHLRRPGLPHSNRSQSPPMAPHNIYATAGTDEWIAVACRSDDDWMAMREVVAEPWALSSRFETLAARLEHQDEMDANLEQWTMRHDRFELAASLQEAGVPAAAVQRPGERIDHDPSTASWGLWPVATHPMMGEVRVEGLPIHLSDTDWCIRRGAPRLGEHNDYVFGELLGIDSSRRAELREIGAI
jgi:crotonobetainyl-CoA:carnitine CoA-transferase CaiB-like acyl-CoA transferase